MNENSEPVSLNARTAHRHRAKRKFNRMRLPTPPPDPTLSEEAASPSSIDKDAHFFEYISSLQKSPHAQFSSIAITEDAFDHLDKLYKLMEQMLTLRQQNARLQRRVRDLEHLKNLRAINSHLDNLPVFEDIPENEQDTLFAENLLDTILVGSKRDVKPKPWTSSRLRQSLLKKQRNISCSINEKASSVDLDNIPDRRSSSGGSGRDKPPSKVSKWTKVKAAFRWEKASPSVTGAKSQDSGISGMLPLNYEVARYLRVPMNSDETGVSPTDSGAADGSTPGTLSSASSADDIHHPSEHGRQISDDDHQSISLDDGQFPRQGSVNDDVPGKSWVKMRNDSSTNNGTREYCRLSVRSDDVKINLSDNEEFETYYENTSKLFKQSSKRKEKLEIPTDIIKRYRQVISEDESINKQDLPKRVSKWTRVKKAFLTPTAGGITSEDKNKTYYDSRSHLSRSQKVVKINKNDEETKKIQDEIQKNYRQLQKQLSIEFQNKLQEWEKLKSSGTANATGIRSDGVAEEQRDQAFIKKMEEWNRIKSQPTKSGQITQMIREEHLAPEFKKKLEEWQKIKKCTVKDDNVQITKSKKKLGEWPKWKSIGNHKDEHVPTEHQQLSDDFVKKMEEWKKIKEHNKQDDPEEKHLKLTRRDEGEPSASSYDNKKRKEQDASQKELQWFEKELSKIEKEKQRLENERQKFLQREERLTKLRRTVMGSGNKKDILIHTPSGFYKFEGISRKFTQKLCEWEKAQGIGPEASTFALLTSTFTPHVRVDLYEENRNEVSGYDGSRLLRSKSAESISTSNLIQHCSSTSHHPSSLSLNDVDELEKQCLSLSGASSLRDLDESLEKLRGNDEPQAVIVEVEDVEEETAALLEERLEEKHFPVYQTEKALNTCEKQSSVVPHIQRNDSIKVQYNSSVINEIIQVLKTIEQQEEIEWKIENRTTNVQFSQKDDVNNRELQKQHEINLTAEDKNESQKQRSDTVLQQLIHLQEMHLNNISDVTATVNIPIVKSFANLSETVQDLFSESFQMAEQLQNTIYGKHEESYNYLEFADFPYSNITAITSELIPKLCELKRILTYFYAASDMNAPSRKFKSIRKTKNEIMETDKKGNDEYKKINDGSSNAHNQNEDDRQMQKRARFKKKSYCAKSYYESEESDFNDLDEKIQNHTANVITVDPSIIEKLVIPTTKTNFVKIDNDSTTVTECSPVEVFVKTTKKVFKPLVTNETTQRSTNSKDNSVAKDDEPFKEHFAQPITTCLPPLPVSPTPQRKMSKDISPSIRIMLAKYNQMISKQDASGQPKSAGSSGSASPVAWRSPISERRVKAQRERYLEEVKKIGEVKKSASVTVLPPSPILSDKEKHKLTQGIFRSTSASAIRTETETIDQKPKTSLKLVIPKNSYRTSNDSSESRYRKLQRAKETFLNSPGTPSPGPSSAPPLLPEKNAMNYPSRSRFSQISMGSESSCDSSHYEGMLIKSASAGMINVDKITYKQIDPAFHQEGYVSLPRSVSKQKEGLLGGKLTLSNIAAKFRKVKMRRSKDQKRMNTVSALCRQSLVVDINSTVQEPASPEKQRRSDSLTVPSDRGASSSEDTSPSSSRSGSWIRRSKIFKAL